MHFIFSECFFSFQRRHICSKNQQLCKNEVIAEQWQSHDQMKTQELCFNYFEIAALPHFYKLSEEQKTTTTFFTW